MAKTDVLIVGAGPTGLVLALWLTRQGVSVRIIDKSAGPGETSRAMVVQARTLELYRQLGMADAVVAAGNRNPAMNMWAHGKHRARVSLADAGADMTPYPFLLVYPQDKHERFLIERLQALGVFVERRTEFLSFADRGDHVEARLSLPDGREELCEAGYLAGCDGARSPIRHQIGANFEGGTYRQVFYVADVEVDGLAPAGEAHIALDTSDFLMVLPYGHKNECRLIGTVRDERADRADTLGFDDVGHEAIDRLGLAFGKVNWFSTYHVHHRVADRFRNGRAFLLGDAAHVHSPAGGQGMNTGIADAINLAWKIAAVVKGQAPDALLDSYEIERQAFARKLVETTDRLFSFASAEGSFAGFVRTRIAPIFMRVVDGLDAVREFMFRIVSQTMIDYQGSPLSEGQAGKVSGGDRLPFVRSGDSDNYTSLAAIGWQAHVYGTAGDDLQAWCRQHGLDLHEFAWTPGHEKAGLLRGATYLLRPDTYIALADASGSAEALDHYFRSRSMASVS